MRRVVRNPNTDMPMEEPLADSRSWMGIPIAICGLLVSGCQDGGNLCTTPPEPSGFSKFHEPGHGAVTSRYKQFFGFGLVVSTLAEWSPYFTHRVDCTKRLGATGSKMWTEEHYMRE